jgi:PilZ domain
MPSFPVPQGRHSARMMSKKPARLVTNLGGVQKMFPCLILDRSREGFRLRGSLKLRHGQLVELVVDDPVDSVPCEVIWVGRAGSRQEGEAGLQTVGK